MRVVKRATSLFNSFYSNVAKQVARFVARFIVALASREQAFLLKTARVIDRAVVSRKRLMLLFFEFQNLSLSK